MEYLKIIVPGLIVVIGAIIHIEASIASLKTDVKWIKKYLNKEEK